MLSDSGEIIYIGKAKNLRSRVRSYFHQSGLREITKMLVTHIADIDYIVVPTEKEALILENQLIKEHKPYFNIDLKDNKTYPFIRLTSDETWPRVYKTREATKKGEYFGPYTDLRVMYHYLEILNELYPLKKCGQQVFPKNFKPCLYFHMGKCLDYCTGNVSKETTDHLTSEIRSFLNGNTAEAKKFLQEKLLVESQEQRYERAALIRDKLLALEQIQEPQQVSLLDQKNFDVIAFFPSEQSIVFSVLGFREGRLMDKKIFPFEHAAFQLTSESKEEELGEALSQFILQYYQDIQIPVSEILLPFLPESSEVLSEIIGEQYFKNYPQLFKSKKPAPKLITARGDKKSLIELAKSNARLSYFELEKDRVKQNYSYQLKEFLNLKKIPRTIECFDIANTGDTAVIAGMVHFDQGKKVPENYRIFNIKSAKGQDDFQSMREAVYRRYSRLLKEEKSLPDLILIDGGKGQLGAAVASLNQLGIKSIAICSIAKKQEELFLPGKEHSIKIPHDNPALRYLVQIRDEVHRYTNGRHVKRRDQEALESRFIKIPGFGPKKTSILQDKYPDLEALKSTPNEEIEQLPYFKKGDGLLVKSALELRLKDEKEVMLKPSKKYQIKPLSTPPQSE